MFTKLMNFLLKGIILGSLFVSFALPFHYYLF